MAVSRRTAWLMAWLSLASTGWTEDSAKSTAGETTSQTILVQSSGGWKRVDTANFRCWSRFSDDEARQLADSCEAWRSRLRNTWLTDAAEESWQPKCEVFVHPNRAAYNHALNRPGDHSVGSTQLKFDHGRTVLRRIDVRADAADWSNAALPHEVTHVVLGERFGGRALPRWADEGMAMLSESPLKHQERLTHLKRTLGQQPTYAVKELLAAKLVPEPHRRDAFYGQSLALASLLIRKSTPAQFADFVEDVGLIGETQALQKHYDLTDVAALQREWDGWVKRPEALSFVSLPIQLEGDPKFALADLP